MRAIAASLLAVVLLGWSAIIIIADQTTAPLREIAERLEAAPHRQPDLQSFARIERALADDRWCVREAVQSHVTIRLAGLDASYRSGDASQRSAALSEARRTLRNGLLCFPRDGNLWLRLAMVEHARSGATDEVQEMLRTSLAMAPSEAWIIIPRISFASRLRDALPSVEDVLRADVNNLLGYGNVADIVELYVHGDAALRAVLAAGFDSVQAARRTAIEHALAARMPEQQTAK